MSRRYLNVVVQELRSRLYSIRRIDLGKDLFYRDCEVAQRTAQVASGNKNKRRVMDGWKNLPPPAINIQPAPSSLSTIMSYSFSLLGGENNILYVDPRCRTSLYSIDSNFFESIPSPSTRKTPNAVSIPICQADPVDPIKRPSQYILDLFPTRKITSCFEVLSPRKEGGWCWDVLPPPPFLRDPEIVPDTYSYAVVKGSAIWISPSMEEGIGTYTFDTVSSNWTRAADWVLPFSGKAEYVPELNLWFGLSGRRPFSSLCAYDLSAMGSAPPMPLYTWDYLDLPEDKAWLPTQLHLLNLGLGKFCVATLFGTMLRTCSYSSSDEDDMDDMDDMDAMDGKEYALLTGLEVKRSNGDGSLQFIKHMSKRYVGGTCNIHSVL